MDARKWKTNEDERKKTVKIWWFFFFYDVNVIFFYVNWP